MRLDAIVASAGTAQGQIEATGKQKIVGKPLFAEPKAVVTDMGVAEWNAEVARVIKDQHADGTIAAISQKWFHTDITKDVQ